jgi:hypothetical protein
MPDWWDKYDSAPLAPIAEGTAYADPNSGQKAMLQGGKPVLLGTQKLNTGDTKEMEDIHAASQAGAQYADLANQFGRLNAQTPTSPYLKPFLVAGHDINPLSRQAATDPNIKSMNQIGTQMAGAGRIPGMKTTQMEWSKFLGNAPSTTDWTTANVGAQNNANNVKIGTGAKTAFYDSWIRNHPTLNGADDAWNHYLGTRLPQFYQGPARTGGQPPPGGMPQAAPATPLAKIQARAAQGKVPAGVTDLGPE